MSTKKTPFNYLSFFNKCIFVLIICFSLILALVIPPFDKPDENLHFYKAVAVSRGTLACPVINNQVINFIPQTIYTYVESETAKHVEPDITNPPLVQRGTEVNETRSCVLPFFYYLVSGLVIFVFTNLHIPVEVIFYAGRVVNTIIALIILAVALRNVPKKLQLISLFIYSLPMSMYQISSYSKDAYHIPLGIYVFNRFICFAKSKKADRGELLTFSIALLLFILTRPQYVWFFLFLLAVPLMGGESEMIMKRIKRFAWVIGSILLLGGTFFLLVEKNIYLSPYNANTSLSYYTQIDPMSQISFILFHPLQFCQTMLTTLIGFGFSYVKGFIGIFGWLNRPLPLIVYLLYLVGGAVVALFVGLSNEIKILLKYIPLLVSIILLTVLNLFLAMYLYATPVGNEIILALQGRYFTMIAPLLMVCASAFIFQLNKVLHKKRH